MARSKSSHRWLKEHFTDPFVKRAQREGLRSRAAYKLDEILERDFQLRADALVVDLGAAPGGWSQRIRQRLGTRGRVIALDILAMEAIPGVEFIHGDFSAEDSASRLVQMMDGGAADLVLSDMAPNMSGMGAVDQPKAMALAELALEFAIEHLRHGGSLVVKLFHGVGFDDYVRRLRTNFTRVIVRKPEASRARSRETYAVAQGLKGPGKAQSAPLRSTQAT